MERGDLENEGLVLLFLKQKKKCEGSGNAKDEVGRCFEETLSRPTHAAHMYLIPIGISNTIFSDIVNPVT